MAKLYFYYSTMNAGKSTSLLQSSHNYQERGMRTLVYTYAADDRGQGKVHSRIGLAAEARHFAPGVDLYREVSAEHASQPVGCLLLDAAQLLEPGQVRQLAAVADQLGVPVLCYGLRTDFQGQLFPGSARLLAIADNLVELKTICHCGRKATMVVRTRPDGSVEVDGEQVEIGGNERYLPLCRKHFHEARGELL
ncbi:MAG: thymidine kinase [Steroidobacteraceae bacterium]